MEIENGKILIEEKNNVILIKDSNKENRQYAVYINNDKDNIKYFDNLVEASLYYNSKILSESKQIEQLKSGLKQVSQFVTFATILQLELDYDIDEITKSNLKQLHLVYEEYLDIDSYNLISDEIYDLVKKFDINEIRLAIIQYLKENNVETSKIDNDELEGMINDVVYYSVESDSDPISLIWMEDYFQGKVDELNGEEELE